MASRVENSRFVGTYQRIREFDELAISVLQIISSLYGKRELDIVIVELAVVIVELAVVIVELDLTKPLNNEGISGAWLAKSPTLQQLRLWHDYSGRLHTCLLYTSPSPRDCS